jgi:thymidylate synthase (FAD)
MSSVKLVAVTKPVIEECEDAEQLIAYCARVSNPNNQANHDTAQKLLKYCAKNSHWSIFEMVNVVMEIKTTRDIGRQILRHRSFSFQEFSQRYAEVDENSFELSECRLQDNRNRQNSIVTHDKALADWWTLNQARLRDSAISLYHAALEKGIAKEVARKVLPEGLTGSTMYMNGTLRSWIHYCDLRQSNGTQKEHVDIAVPAWHIITDEFPSMLGIVDK